MSVFRIDDNCPQINLGPGTVRLKNGSGNPDRCIQVDSATIYGAVVVLRFDDDSGSANRLTIPIGSLIDHSTG